MKRSPARILNSMTRAMFTQGAGVRTDPVCTDRDHPRPLVRLILLFLKCFDFFERVCPDLRNVHLKGRFTNRVHADGVPAVTTYHKSAAHNPSGRCV
jgi:hypothetical protein